MEPSEDGEDAMPRDDEELKTKKDKYKVLALLGKGGYGAVYSVLRLSDSEKFAIKCENASALRKALYMDCNVLKGAAQIKSRHFCTVVDRAAVKDRFNFIVMKLIGRNLWDLRMDTPDFQFSLGTALKAAAQCLVCIEQIHRFGYLHRDIKPGNFCIGRKESNEHHVIFLLDFGLCREYVNRAQGKIRNERSSAPFRGTTRYAPLNSMLELDTGRKDDIESWLYMVVEWTSGQLPWHKWKSADRKEVLQAKKDIRGRTEITDEFLHNCPKKEFARILKYVDTLDFYSTPDYKFVYCCIQHAALVNNIKDTDPIDWDPDSRYYGPVETPGDGKVIELEVEQGGGVSSNNEMSNGGERGREGGKEKESEPTGKMKNKKKEKEKDSDVTKRKAKPKKEKEKEKASARRQNKKKPEVKLERLELSPARSPARSPAISPARSPASPMSPMSPVSPSSVRVRQERSPNRKNEKLELSPRR